MLFGELVTAFIWRPSSGPKNEGYSEKVPNPSSRDYEDWGKTLYHGDFVGDYLVFMIVGIQQIRLWQGDRRGQFLELSKPEVIK